MVADQDRAGNDALIKLYRFMLRFGCEVKRADPHHLAGTRPAHITRQNHADTRQSRRDNQTHPCDRWTCKMGRIRFFRHEGRSTSIILFHPFGKIYHIQRHKANHVRPVENKITYNLLSNRKAIGIFPIAFFVIFPVFSGRIPIFATDLRYFRKRLAFALQHEVW